MADREILQRGSVVKIDSKGVRTSRPFTDEDRDRIDQNSSSSYLTGGAGLAEAALRGRKQKLDDSINDATHVNYGGNPGSSIRGRQDSGHDE